MMAGYNNMFKKSQRRIKISFHPPLAKGDEGGFQE